jgi:hypothetical protein
MRTRQRLDRRGLAREHGFEDGAVKRRSMATSDMDGLSMDRDGGYVKRILTTTALAMGRTVAPKVRIDVA